MKISLITATYNSEEFLADCIRSVIRQTYRDIEYIIVDGGSTDGTAAIVNKYGTHVHKFISGTDLGVYDAMNKGIAISTGEVIGTLNSDDLFASDDVLERIAFAFHPKTGQSPDIVYGDLWYVDRNNPQKVLRKWISRTYHKKLFQFGWMPAHPTFYAKKVLFDRHGAYDISYSSASDYELMLRFLYGYKCNGTYLNKVLVLMRTGGLSNKTFRNRVIANREDRRAMHQHHIVSPFMAAILKPLGKIFQYLHLFKGVFRT